MQHDVIAFLREENRVLKAWLGRRLRVDDQERRRLAVLGKQLGRGILLREFATLITPDTIETFERSAVLGPVRSRQRLGGLLNYYYRAA